MNKNFVSKVLEHPDREELISKIMMGVSPKECSQALHAKYTNVGESKFQLSEKVIKQFQDNYLDIYNYIKRDMSNTKNALATSNTDQLQLAVQNNSDYKAKMLELADKEVDVKKMISHLVVAVETRFYQIMDEIQDDPRNINSKVDRLLIEYVNALTGSLEKLHKFTEGPSTMVVQHNVNVQMLDHVTIIHDVIKDVLAQMDIETSMYFMEKLSERMGSLNLPDKEKFNTDARLAEAKILSQTITDKLNT